LASVLDALLIAGGAALLLGLAGQTVSRASQALRYVLGPSKMRRFAMMRESRVCETLNPVHPLEAM
jgi:hypothetical protein